jgi:hypothetical protein
MAYVRKPKIQMNSKFDSRSKKCILLGYADEYRLWSLDEKKVIVACDVIFDENKRLTRLNEDSKFHTEDDHWKISVFGNDISDEGTQDDLVQKGGDDEKEENEEGEVIDQEVLDIEPIVTRSGTVKRPAYLENCALSAMSYSDSV